MSLRILISCLCLFSSSLGVKFNFELERQEKSLLNTFPFNEQDDNGGQEHHSHDSNDNNPPANFARGLRQPQIQLDARNALQGNDRGGGVSFDAVAQSSPGNDGKKCIDKVEMVEETEYDDIVQCDHSYDRRCHISYITNYVSQQEVECEENYVKNCYIDYEKIAFNETIKVCRNPLVKDCGISGPEICKTVYESECWTKQEVHDVEDDVVDCKTEYEEKCVDETAGYTSSTKCAKWPKEVCSVSKKQVKKYTPVTGCNKEPRELCAPAGCGFKQGPEECHDEKKTIVQDAPKEECTLEPRRTCKHVTKLVPKLEPKEECVDVPKEVCTRSRQNPRKVRKPVIKKWCYVPSEESGLA
eukprot:GFUD01043075.1.p1 GENE.GFUD01043075.1~~GFUD01043075.1.p1  ORF type:complete len:357 (+),score=115.63 GFUD01043075.1:146-1216(+)